MTKHCGKCSKQQPVEKFSKFKGAPDGLAYTCKDCVKAADRARYDKNRVQVLATQKEYNLQHKAEKAAYDKKYRDTLKGLSDDPTNS